jgi:hypothetical protein
MIEKSKLRQKLISKIKRLSDDKLNSLARYIRHLEADIKSSSEILSFSGIFKDLDKETIDELTTKLHDQRLQGSSRIQ